MLIPKLIRSLISWHTYFLTTAKPYKYSFIIDVSLKIRVFHFQIRTVLCPSLEHLRDIWMATIGSGGSLMGLLFVFAARSNQQIPWFGKLTHDEDDGGLRDTDIHSTVKWWTVILIVFLTKYLPTLLKKWLLCFFAAIMHKDDHCYAIFSWPLITVCLWKS